MDFDFFDIGQTRKSTLQVPLARLATHVLTDWIPGVPPALAAGFANILGEMLKTGRRGHWHTAPEVVGFERQWRMATSWILGIAYCREVIEHLGYPIWSPVSAFYSQASKTKAAYWTPKLPRVACDIRKPKPAKSRLLPDYVAARVDPVTNDMAIAFAESKGSSRAIASRKDAPKEWRAQANNAEFYFNGKKILAERHIVVATRVNPGAKLEWTRRVVVRAWNSHGQSPPIPFDAASELLATHYFALCEALGLRSTARRIALAAKRDIQVTGGHTRRWQAAFAETEEGYTRDSARQEWLVMVGERRLVIRLGPTAVSAIRALASPDSGRADELKQIMRTLGNRHRTSEVSEHEVELVRPDGLVATFE